MSRTFFTANPFTTEHEDTVIPVVDPGAPVDFSSLKSKEPAAPATPQPAAPPQEVPLPTEATPCPLCADAEKARLLALAELENARKRLAREKEEFLRYAGETVITDILPALDNLDLALAYAPDNADCKNFVVGVDMTRKLLLDSLARHGLTPVGELGETFDPARHEAVGLEPSPGYMSGQVCKLLNKGYLLKERLVRPAKVIVCKNEE